MKHQPIPRVIDNQNGVKKVGKLWKLRRVALPAQASGEKRGVLFENVGVRGPGGFSGTSTRSHGEQQQQRDGQKPTVAAVRCGFAT